MLLSQKQVQHTDIAWFLARLLLQETLLDADDDLTQTEPVWSAFSAKTQDTNVRCSAIGCTQVNYASPTELATVYIYSVESLTSHGRPATG